jgi:hypothetical protein
MTMTRRELFGLFRRKPAPEPRPRPAPPRTVEASPFSLDDFYRARQPAAPGVLPVFVVRKPEALDE